MRFLLSSLIVFFLGCTPYPKKLGYSPDQSKSKTFTNPYFSDLQKDYVYKANISAFKNEFSGILVIKKTDENKHRVAFTTELGNTIFDFSIGDDSFEVNHILKKMDRKLLLNVLEQDFRTLIKENIAFTETYAKENTKLLKAKIGTKNHYYNFKKDTLQSIAKVGNQKEIVVITFSERSENLARHIQILHKNIKLAISLQAI
ncbi:hypothetical protein PP182_03050 [Maribacter sp. PR1]|uniref:DUF4252 domain-containing protein n=1 Tax=Maribacter cobaltidurans TaxID=1178778 RepID=A0ABU7IR46_9FLAO|nr:MULTISPECIES: hypothetical protein [Maribacter]MDC6387643.1 hypothetical protein [Maribacter sp. PR1]MEE1975031.1 hypothetical protein [Maribacter cobaltidurans]